MAQWGLQERTVGEGAGGCRGAPQGDLVCLGVPVLNSPIHQRYWQEDEAACLKSLWGPGLGTRQEQKGTGFFPVNFSCGPLQSPP